VAVGRDDAYVVLLPAYGHDSSPEAAAEGAWGGAAGAAAAGAGSGGTSSSGGGGGGGGGRRDGGTGGGGGAGGGGVQALSMGLAYNPYAFLDQGELGTQVGNGLRHAASSPRRPASPRGAPAHDVGPMVNTHTRTPQYCAWSADSSLVAASCDLLRTVSVWRASGGELVWRFTGNAAPVLPLRFFGPRTLVFVETRSAAVHAVDLG
jgi:hypothetical protein